MENLEKLTKKELIEIISKKDEEITSLKYDNEKLKLTNKYVVSKNNEKIIKR